MTAVRLSRAAALGRAAPPPRLLHLGLGNFFRAHQAWFTEHSADADGWGYAAFTGRRAELARRLCAQDGLYTLVVRRAEGDAFEVISSLSHVHAAADHEAWLTYFTSSELAAVSITVTEAGYLRRADGGLDADRQEVRADLEALRRDVTAPVRTAPGRLVSGVAARRTADAGPLSLVPCDNVSGNGAIVETVVRELAELVDPSLAAWLADSVSVVTTMVDRITPRTVPDDVRGVVEATGVDDTSPVVTEPFAEWVLSGAFPGGRPRWETAGATFTDDVTPFEHRKLWLLNGAHTLLAYGGSIMGYTTVAEAVGDDVCRSWVQEWWAEASAHLDQPADDLAVYRTALLERFANTRIRHLLAQIAADGSQKVPIRILPVLAAERAAGRLPTAATRVLAAWICHLRGIGVPVDDARADDVVALAGGSLPDAVRRVLGALDPMLADDEDVTKTVVMQAEELTTRRRDR